MAGTQDVPRPQDRCNDAICLNQRFALLSNRNVLTHHRSRMRHADIDEMAHSSLTCSERGRFDGGKVDALELGCLRGTRVRCSNQVNEGRVRRYRVGKRRRLEGIANHRTCTSRKFVRRGCPNERSDYISPFEQRSDQRPADVARSTSDEDRIHGADTPAASISAINRAISSRSGRLCIEISSHGQTNPQKSTMSQAIPKFCSIDRPGTMDDS